MVRELVRRIASSDVAGVSEQLEIALSSQEAWRAHLSLFPVAQYVLNPPFINPHLPKMYGVLRYFLPYLGQGDMALLVKLEANEYARRPKLNPLPQLPKITYPVSLANIQNAVGERNVPATAQLMQAYLEQSSRYELGRSLLLLGCEYMDKTLGHSVSCTAFIVLEMIERDDQDPWPAITALADYFCKGQFRRLPEIPPFATLPGENFMVKATSGSGIADIHHTITRYAIERIRHLFSEDEYAHMIWQWVKYVGDKQPSDFVAPVPAAPKGYDAFLSLLRSNNGTGALASLLEVLSRHDGSVEAGRYLIRAVAELYSGDYDPHFITGLGAVLWVMEEFPEDAQLVGRALEQYLMYFIQGRS